MNTANPFFRDTRTFLPTEDKANTRKIIANGTSELLTPGLKSVEAVRIGRMEIPLEIVQEYPDNVRREQKHFVPMPMILLDANEAGEPLLRRSIFSNDGIWQEGAEVFVTGEWEGESVAEEKAPAKGKIPVTA